MFPSSINGLPFFRHTGVTRSAGFLIIAVSAAFLAFPPHVVSAQGVIDAPSTPVSSSSHPLTSAVVFGGMILGDSRLALVKGELSRGKWAAVGDITRDDTRESWEATPQRLGSQDSYVLWATSTTIRRYSRTGGRGVYAEIGGGAARMTLRSRVNNAADTTRTATIPMATWGVGTRAGLGRTRAFVELAYRSAVPLQTRHVHIDATPPAGSTNDAISYRSWYLGRGKPSGQLYAALGVRF
jgi:hypothetical protein